MKAKSSAIFCFTIERQIFAIPLETVDQVLLAMEVMVVPNSPQIIHGVIDYHGDILPVIDLRFRLNLPLTPIRIHDIFIIAETSKRKIALVADEANDVLVPGLQDLVAASDLDAGFEAAGILRREDGIILIYDMEDFLSNTDEIFLKQAIDQHTHEITKP